MKLVKSLLLGTAVTTGSVIGLTGCQSSDHSDHSGHNHGSAATSATITTAAAKPYTLKTCIVTDETFDHGKPYSFVHEGQEIKLCCDGCKPDFDKEPAKYLKKLAAK